MTNDEQVATIRRVLLAAHTGSVADESIKTARAIAAAFQAELTALFVEDPNLVRMAALPFTRETGGASGLARQIEPADMERALRLQADRMRRSLQEVASFRVERGWFGQRVLAAISDSVAAVILPASRMPQSYRSRTMRPSHGVMAVYDGSVGAARALALALRLSQAHDVLRVAVAAGTDREFLARQEAVRSRASAASVRVEFVRLATDHPMDLARAARDHAWMALLLSGGSMEMTPQGLTLLLDNLYCPLVLLE